MLARGAQGGAEFQIIAAAQADDFDRWNSERDQLLDQSVSARYVSPDVPGTEELDANGDWVYDDPYGYVWAPRVAPGWAPYREGRWGWEDYYGWTWISADPWGWAPYHYGRWYSGPRGWLWYPGAIGARHYWHPALVGFFGWGGGGYGGFGFGNVGWVPLAPHETFRPWYGARFGGRPGFNSYSVVSNTNIGNVYRNARFDRGVNGVTSVRAGDFGRGQIHSSNFVRAGEGDLHVAGDIRGQVPVAPGNESRRFADRNVNPQAFPRSNNNAQFYRRGQGPATQPNGLRGGNVNGGNLNGNAGGIAGGNNVTGNPGNNPGWRRLDGGGAPSRGVAPQAPVQSGGGGFNQGNNGNLSNGNPSNGNPGGWRRLDRGTPNPAVNNPNVNNGGTSPANNGNWRRLDGPPVQRGPGNFGGGVRQISPQVNQPAPPSYNPPVNPSGTRGGQPYQQPNVQRQFGGGERPVQINAPIVRERPNDAGGTRPYGGFGQARPYAGGGAPAPMRSNPGGGGGGPAPSHGNGGGGGNGGNHSNSGGGGGHRGR